MSHKGMHSEEEGMEDSLPVSCKSFECLYNNVKHVFKIF